MDLENEAYWLNLGIEIAHRRSRLGRNDILDIMKVLNFGGMKEEYLPKDELADKKLSDRKWQGIQMVSDYWKMEVKEFMQMESEWLQAMRTKSGSSRDDDKKKPEDLVVPQILTKIVATAYFFYQNQTKLEVADQLEILDDALESLDLFIRNACFKGMSRSSSVVVGGKKKNKYTFLVHHGITVGTTGLFLPDPEVNMPKILMLFFGRDLNKDIYK